MTTRPAQRKTRRHWYFISVWECPLCSRTTEIRERRYGAKPKTPEKTREYIPYACGGHFI